MTALNHLDLFEIHYRPPRLYKLLLYSERMNLTSFMILIKFSSEQNHSRKNGRLDIRRRKHCWISKRKRYARSSAYQQSHVTSCWTGSCSQIRTNSTRTCYCGLYQDSISSTSPSQRERWIRTGKPTISPNELEFNKRVIVIPDLKTISGYIGLPDNLKKSLTQYEAVMQDRKCYVASASLCCDHETINTDRLMISLSWNGTIASRKSESTKKNLAVI